MKYVYRDTLDSRTHYPELDEQGHRMLDAAFAIADAAHKNQSRQKIDPAIRYITHPIMVCDILYRRGIRDPQILAAALLHDALERGSTYQSQPEGLHRALLLALAEEFKDERAKQPDIPQRLGHDAARIMRWTMQLTNPEFLEGKELGQIDHVSDEDMDFEAKIIKIADQTASLICNLTMPNDPREFKPLRERRFMEKALSVAIAIVNSGQTPEEIQTLKRWGSFFGRIYLQAERLFNYPEGASDETIARHREVIRGAFDYDKFVNDTTDVSLPPRLDIAYHLSLEGLAHDSIPTIAGRHGLARVDFDARGHVVSYVIWADPQGKISDVINQTQEQLTEQLRRVRRMANPWSNQGEPVIRGILQPAERMQLRDEEIGRIVGYGRIYYLSPALPANAFQSAAFHAGACNKEQADEIMGEGARLEEQNKGQPGTEFHALKVRGSETQPPTPKEVDQKEKPGKPRQMFRWTTDSKRAQRPMPGRDF